MYIIKTDIAGVLILEPDIFNDNRGYFFESYSEAKFREATGLDITFIQDNESLSSYGVLRGLHFQNPPYEQAKLVRVVKGKVWDVTVDIRRDSPTFGKYVAVELSGENKRQLFIPRGFAHGYVVLEDNTIFQYKCDNYFAPEHQGAVIWNDPQIGIMWPIPKEDIILSEKDKNNPALYNYTN